MAHESKVSTLWLFKEKFADPCFKLLCFRIIVT